MKLPRLAVVALLVTVAACSGGDDGTAPSTSSSTSSTTTSTSTTQPEAELYDVVAAVDLVELDVDLPRRIPAASFTWVIEVTNSTDDPVVLTFPTSQPGDARLLRDDEQIHRWSDGKFFTMEVTQRVVGPDETIEVELFDDLSGIEPGYYTLLLELGVHGAPEPLEDTVRIVSPT